ncbi:MAG: sulfotransferase [Planctomycetia bacterium]|nr:sulfotransferase [Planctomycetia bacterium]
MILNDLRFFYSVIPLLVRSVTALPDGLGAAVFLTMAQFNPIFITGFPRSGTTMVAAILDRHSDIAISPETYFFQAMKDVNDTPSARPRQQIMDHLLNAYGMRDLKLQSEDVCPLLNGTEFTPRHILQAVLTAYQRQRGKPLIGEKTPRHIMQAGKLLAWYPEAKMIFVIRDGRDAVASILKVPWRNHEIVRLHAATWRRYMKVAYQIHQRDPNRCIFVKYEDVLSHPEVQVRRLDHFCGVPFEAQQVSASVPTQVVPKWEEPWKLLATGPIEPDHIGNWRTIFTPEDQWALNDTMRPYLKLFGYRDYTLSGCPMPRRLWLAATGLLLRTGETRKIYRSALARFDSRKRNEPACQQEIPQPSSVV